MYIVEALDVKVIPFGCNQPVAEAFFDGSGDWILCKFCDFHLVILMVW